MSSEEVWKVRIMDQYEVEATAQFVREKHFQKVCLQFPDHLLSDAPKVVDELERQTEAEYYVLGDTAYAPCCVDVVAAQHVAADAVVHFGHACWNPTRGLPVYYVFEKKQFIHRESLARMLKQNTNKTHLVVLFESYYRHVYAELFEFLKCQLKDKDLVAVRLRSSSLDGVDNTGESVAQNTKYCIGHLKFELPCSVPSEQLHFVWLGNPGSPSFLRASLSLYPFVLDCYDDSTDTYITADDNVSNIFKRRLALIARARNCRVFGIVVNAIATVSILDAIERCETLLNNFEMEWYLLNVGKPTPTKLANFPEIEVFIFIGCPEGAFLDSKDYMKPVLTLAELELALDSNLYFTDVGPIHDFQVALSRPLVSKQQDLDDDGESCDNITNALSKLNSDRDLITYDITSSNSATFLKSRSWKGVEEEPGENNEPHASKEGRYGIPSGYSHEGSLQLDRPI